MAFLGKLFGGKGKSTKKYEDIYFQARKMGQSVEYAFRQAVDRGVQEGVFESQAAGAKQLFELVKPFSDNEDIPNLEKAVNRMTS